MAEHIGERVKYLVENRYKGTKKAFAGDLGLKNHTYLHKVFLKDNLSTKMLDKISGILGISVVDIISADLHQVNEPKPEYGDNVSTLKREVAVLKKEIDRLNETVISKDQIIASMAESIAKAMQKVPDKKDYPKVKFKKNESNNKKAVKAKKF